MARKSKKDPREVEIFTGREKIISQEEEEVIQFFG
jgi:hypothetical protein